MTAEATQKTSLLAVQALQDAVNEELEKKAYLEIVTGQKPLSYFDEFVKEWNRQGGEKIRGEVAQELKGK